MEEDTKADQNICSLCTTEMINYGVGICNHVICGKCAIRMRVKVQSKECAVCRQNLDRIFITKYRRGFEDLDQSKLILNNEFDLLFETTFEERYFLDLMTCKCKVCGDISSSMSALNRHYNNVHQLMFCDLCMNNLKHFPVEFPVYTGAELIAHRNWTPEAPGRGHPLCKFCEKRYYDADEWYKHLRRDHFMCHVCEKEAANTTTKRTVFGDYESLLEHCRTAHYVCEEGACAQQLFTNMFASEAELKAHRLSYHNLTKAEARENRRLDVEIRFTADTMNDAATRRDRAGPGGGRGGATGGNLRAYRKNREPAPESSGLGLDMRNLPGMAQMMEINQTVEAQSAARANGEVPYQENPHDFPTLGGSAPTFNRPGHVRASPIPVEKDVNRDVEEGDLWIAPKQPTKDTAEKKIESKNWQRVMNPSSLTSDDFPALSKPSATQKGSVGGGVWQKSKSPQSKKSTPSSVAVSRTQSKQPLYHNSDDFPSLSVCKSASSTNTTWRPSVPMPTRSVKQVPSPKLSNTEDFPSLGDGKGSTSSKNLPWESIIKPATSVKKTNHSAGKPTKKLTDSSNSYKSHELSTKVSETSFETSDQKPSYAEEKVGRRLTAMESYESVGTQNVQGKVKLIKEAPAVTVQRNGNSCAFRMMDDDFPSMTRHTPAVASSTDNHWGSQMTQSDLYLEVSEDRGMRKNKKSSYRHEAAPNVESAFDFPSLGGSKSRERIDPTSVAHQSNAKENKKGKKGRRNRQFDSKEGEEVNVRPSPIETPFSLGDLAASLLNVQYQEVPDMNLRNQVLFDSLMELLGERFETFAQISTSYRNREMSARSYIEAIGDLVKKAEVASFMPEMLVLLPDIGLQKSLMAVIEPELRRHLRECSTCGQIVTTDDLPFHLSVH